MGEYSQIVAEGMKRACNAFTQILQPLGFNRGRRRSWVRECVDHEETIFLSRSGATYGAPYSASISLLLDLRSIRMSDGKRVFLDHHTVMRARRHTGYCYHHRFNAETGSTYDRCLQELDLFVLEVAEPWFEKQRLASE